jgi:hypothetical protein
VARIWLGAFVEHKTAMRAWLRPIYPASAEPEASDEPIALVVAFAAYKLVFQVFIPLVEGDLSLRHNWDDTLISLWPPSQEQVRWPPKYRFAPDSVEYLAARINDGRQPLTGDFSLRSSYTSPDPVVDA